MKKLILLITAIFMSVASYAQNEFTTTWDMSTAGSGAGQIAFNYTTTATVNYTWTSAVTPFSGSGTIASGSGTKTITGLPTSGILTLNIGTGGTQTSFKKFQIANNSDKKRLTAVTQWGTATWTDFTTSYLGCSNFNVTATDYPNLSACNSMSNSFADCISLNSSNFSGWNVSTITSFRAMFYGCSIFDADLSSWNVSAATELGYMFYFAKEFTNAGVSLSSWNLNAAINLENLFAGTKYNKPLNWCGTTLNGVTNMSYMFYNNPFFNQDISCWDVSTVSNFLGMFYNDTSFTNAGVSLSGWNMNSAVSISNMFNNCKYNLP